MLDLHSIELFAKHHDFFYTSFEILLILCVTFLANFLLKKFYKKTESGKSEHKFYLLTIASIKFPLRIFIWVLSISYIILLLNRFLQFHVLDSVFLVRKIVFIFLFLTFLINLVNKYEKYSKEHSTLDGRIKAPIGVVCRILKILLVVFTILSVVETSGINISGIVAFGSVSGIIIGFASKDLLANFFGATLVYLDKPFEIGDWVRSPDKNIEGTIESISWRLTKIRTFDKRPIYVPNSLFNSIVIENASRMSHRRMREVIGIRYEDMNKVETIIAKIKDMLMHHEGLDTSQTTAVNLNQFSASSVDLLIYVFTKSTNFVKYQETKQDVLLNISKIIKENGAEIAFPTQTIYIEKPTEFSR
ncbi:MAG: MscS family membrane protein [Candidatus Midichloriaceae bacterium]|jgi:MscS family membrane protein